MLYYEQVIQNTGFTKLQYNDRDYFIKLTATFFFLFYSHLKL